MANRIPGSGPVYESFWFTNRIGVKATSIITKGDIVTTAPSVCQKITTDGDTLAIKGYGQAVENQRGGATDGLAKIQIAIAPSMIRLTIGSTTFKSGDRATLEVTAGGEQKAIVANAAAIAAGKSFATFMHVEATTLDATPADGDVGVFLLG